MKRLLALTLTLLLALGATPAAADGAHPFFFRDGLTWASGAEEALAAEGAAAARTDAPNGAARVVVNDAAFAGRRASRSYLFDQNGSMYLVSCECAVDPALAGDGEAAYADVKAALTAAYGEPNLAEPNLLLSFYESMGVSPDRSAFEDIPWSGWLLPDRTAVFASHAGGSVSVLFLRHQRPSVAQMAAGVGHIAVLLDSGRVVAFGANESGETDVADWTDIQRLSCGGYATYGLKSDGTLRTAGYISGDMDELKEWSDIVQVEGGDFHVVGLKRDGTVVACGKETNGQCDVSDWTGIRQIACGESHTVGLRTDGTVVAVGKNYENQCDVGGWTDIVQIAASRSHTVGLKADGTVVAAGGNDYRRSAVDTWTDIAFVACSDYHTFGLRADGTIVDTGSQSDGLHAAADWTDVERLMTGDLYVFAIQRDGTALAVGANESEDSYEFDHRRIEDLNAYLNGEGTPAPKREESPAPPEIAQMVGGAERVLLRFADGSVSMLGLGYSGYGYDDLDWTDVTQLAGGLWYGVGLRADGTVVAVGNNRYGQCDVDGWTDVSQIACGLYHTLALKQDGTVAAIGDNERGQCDVDGWTDVARLAGGAAHSVGLRADGTVVAAGWNEFGQCDADSWTDIAQIACGANFTLGLRADGTVVAVGANEYGQCDVDGWTDVAYLAGGDEHSVGLRTDGTVVAAGWNEFGQCDVDGWTDIALIAAGERFTIGLRTDGTLLCAGEDDYGLVEEIYRVLDERANPQ